MTCPFCEEEKEKQVEMELEESAVDYYDPADFYGHGQYEVKFWHCPECNNDCDFIPEAFELEDDEAIEEEALQIRNNVIELNR